jgi:YidC/Oxa1 family membrane protein insertase
VLSSVNKKRRTLLLIAVMLLAVTLLTGCTIPTGPVDLDNPAGAWNTVVYTLAKILIAINTAIAGVGIPGSWGWAIIVLTVGIKLVTLPLTLKQLQSTRAQQTLQPKLRELQEKYGKDRQKLAEEQMKLYKEAGVNPMGGCLPLLVQLPVLWGLYQALYVLAAPGVEQLQNARFLWIGDLSFPWVNTIDASGNSVPYGTTWIGQAFSENDWGRILTYFSLPILMLVTQMLLQKMSQPPKDPSGKQDTQARMMGQMMLFMPIMFAWITLGLPSGLTLYWTVSNILSMIQQYFVTGWGGLGDWLPFLRKPQLAHAVVTTQETVTQGLPERPIKRRKRRR